ncbi:hypothetical protein diail_5747 [Diaporthe ilicicola]|nr:hypothetical protein diail_5747 [Diaporthe ilicicola]
MARPLVIGGALMRAPCPHGKLQEGPEGELGWAPAACDDTSFVMQLLIKSVATMATPDVGPVSTISSTRRQTRAATSHTPAQDSSKARMTPPPDWLPPARPHRIFKATKVLRRGNLHAHTHRDWFLALVSVMESKDQIQSKMVAKLYLFLRDFIPHGLTGRFSHIQGNDVMNQLLCHFNESTMSRHKVTKYAESVFTELEQWMGSNQNWQEALRQAKADFEKRRTGKKRAGGKAPGLHTAAALLAVLAISHPDARFRTWVGKLQIDWMMTQRRDTLHVASGFWAGLNGQNLGTVFAADNDARDAETPILLDFNRIFGADFLSCRKDIRTVLPGQWAAMLAPLTEAPSDTDDLTESDTGQSAGGQAMQDATDESCYNSAGVEASSQKDTLPQVTFEEILMVRMHLNGQIPASKDLETWLVNWLADGDDVLTAWCAHWEKRINKVNNYQDQKIIRSLFLSSLYRLKGFAAISPSLAHAFMLVDCGDGKTARVEGDESGAREALTRSPNFAPCREANNELIRIVEAEVPSADTRHRLEAVLRQQVLFFCDFSQHSAFYSRHWQDLFHFEALCTRSTVQGYQDPAMLPDEIGFWRCHRDTVFQNLNALKLKGWQVRALLALGAERKVLTDSQEYFFRHKFCTERRGNHFAIDPVEVIPQPVAHDTFYPRSVREKHGNLYKLFGEISQPNLEIPVGPASLPPLVIPAPGTPLPSWHPSQDGSPVQDAGKKASRFIGKSYRPDKRAGSPLANTQSPKFPRINAIVTRDTLVEELQQCKAELQATTTQARDDLRAHLAEHHTRLCEANAMVEAGRERHELDWLAKMEAQLTKGINAQIQPNLSKVAAIQENALTELREIKKGLGELNGTKQQTEALTREVGGLRKDLLAELVAVKEENQILAQKVSEVQSLLATMRNSQTKSLSPGDPGYLARSKICTTRPRSILELRFRDIEVLLIRDPLNPHGPPRLVVELSVTYTKRYLGPKAEKKFIIPEIMFDPSLYLSPHVFLFAILCRHRAFDMESLNDDPYILNNISDALRNLMMDHALNSDTFQKHYLNRFVCADLWAIHRAQAPQDALIKPATSHGSSRNSHRPINLTQAQLDALKASPQYIQLTDEIESLRRRTPERRKLSNRRKALLKAVDEVRKEWKRTQSRDDTERQLQGQDFATQMRPSRLAGPAQQRMLDALQAPLINEVEAQFRRRTDAILAIMAYCHIEEPLTTRLTEAQQPRPPPELEEKDPMDRARRLRESTLGDVGSVRRCFYCVSKALTLPPDDPRLANLARDFYDHAAFRRHFETKHLKPMAANERGHCPICGPTMSFVDKMHFQNHAEGVHGIRSARLTRKRG